MSSAEEDFHCFLWFVEACFRHVGSDVVEASSMVYEEFNSVQADGKGVSMRVYLSRFVDWFGVVLG